MPAKLKRLLTDLIQQLGQAALVIGVDSGLAHLSAALGTPTLGLYGPTNGLLTGCRGRNAQYLQASVACSPCLAKRCTAYRGAPEVWRDRPVQPPCFANQLPERVWARGRAMIDAHSV